MIEEVLHRRGTTLVRRLCLAPGEATPWRHDPFHRLTVVLRGGVLAEERNCGQTLFCNRAARVKGSKLAPAPQMVVWQGPLFSPRSARAAAASWSQARARCINLRGCVVADRASSSGQR
jgi:hypothetical protein